MNILFLCGVFAPENEAEIGEFAKRPIEYSANIFQKKLIRGFQMQDCKLTVLSAPFIGSYPNASSLRAFSGFRENSGEYTYVSFNNTWGVRNFSRASSLKKAMQNFINNKDDRKIIIVYSPHTPFLEAAVYAKRKNPSIKICLIVPDLPQYMNLDAKVSNIYKLAKKVDIARFNKLNRFVDSYMLLTEPMKEKIGVGNRPYCVVEGIIDPDIFEKNEQRKRLIKKPCEEKYIVYTGKMNEKFGVKKLVDAFLRTTNPSYRLVLCGSGDADAYVQSAKDRDSRIIALGQVSPQEAHDWVLKADVLVNPRENNEEYTKYSFPSKNIEYLASGNPVIANMLDGMPRCYCEYMYVLNQNNLYDVILEVLECDTETLSPKYELVKQYFTGLTGVAIANKLRFINNMS